jgi:hypothetical protein
MQRLFSTFPTGTPGLGLLVLRLAIAGALLMHAAPLQDAREYAVEAGVCAVLAAIIAAGFLTPLAAMQAAIVCGIGLYTGHSRNPAEDVLAISVAIALGLIGAGAYSIDARLYGRRQIRISLEKKE